MRSPSLVFFGFFSLSALLSFSFAQTSLTFSAASFPFPNRTLQACAFDLSHSPPSPSASVYVLGGFSNGFLYSDIWQSNSSTSTSSPFFLVNDPTYPAPYAAGAGAALLLNSDLLWFGGEGGIADNDVWLSQDGGRTWIEITANAGWSSRSLFAYTTLPQTDIVVIAGGQLSSNAAQGFNASDVWITEDGIGQVWLQQSANPPFGAVMASALIGLYDHTLVMTGGIRNTTAISEVWVSSDVGMTWVMQGIPVFGSRAHHTMAVDGDDIIYVVGGMGPGVTTGALDVYASNTKGASWVVVTVSSSVSSLINACAFVRAGTGGLSLVLYGGSDGNGTAQGVVVGSLTSTLSPASSTGILLNPNATETGKPLLPTVGGSGSVVVNGSSTGLRWNVSSSTGVGSSAAEGNAGVGIVAAAAMIIMAAVVMVW